MPSPVLVRLRENLARLPSSTADMGPQFVIKPAPVATDRDIQRAEARLGFKLPGFLRELYQHVANGGFGPPYGLIGVHPGALDSKQDVVDLYLEYSRSNPKDRHWKWPRGLLPVIHLGCAMYLCVPALEGEALVWFEPNPHEAGEPWDESFISTPYTLEGLLSDWMEGVDWFARVTGEV